MPTITRYTDLPHARTKPERAGSYSYKAKTSGKTTEQLTAEVQAFLARIKKGGR